MARKDPVKEFVARQVGKSPSAKKHARIVASAFLESVKNPDPEKITTTDVFHYLSNIEKSCSRSTLYIYASQLRTFLGFLGREDLAKLVKPPRRPQALKTVPSDEEVAKMIALAEPRDRLIIQILTRTGLRVGELTHLEPGDVDHEERQIYIRAKEHWAPKGLKERIVPVDSETARLIGEYLGGRDKGLLFDVSESSVRRIVKDLAVKAQVKNAEKVSPHSLRHSFAVHFLQHGGDIRSLQIILGHSDLSTTAVYLSFTEEAVAQAYDRIFEKEREA